MTESSALSATRKDDHVRLALEQAQNRNQKNGFDDISLIHHALAAVDVGAVSLETDVLGRKWHSPIYINAMTGGSDSTLKINESLARVANTQKIAIASGSMSPIFKDGKTEKSFKVLRDLNPNGFIFANLNANATVEQAKKAVGLISADALQIHLNSVQEIIMSEGDRTFSHWSDHIAKIVAALDIPVIVKEVGFGMSYETGVALLELGVKHIDTAGSGGTNFAVIENSRSGGNTHKELLDWGMTTVQSTIELSELKTGRLETLLASGGVRNAFDAVKALALGADAVGIAGGFLRTLKEEGESKLLHEIDSWHQTIRKTLSLIGAKKPSELRNVQLLVRGDTGENCRLRKIDLSNFALRGRETK